MVVVALFPEMKSCGLWVEGGDTEGSCWGGRCDNNYNIFNIVETTWVVGVAISVVDFHLVDMLSQRDRLVMVHAYCSVILYFN